MELIGVAEMGRSVPSLLFGISCALTGKECSAKAFAKTQTGRMPVLRRGLGLPFCFGWRRGGGFGFFGQLREAGSVFYGDVGQDFAV